VAGDQLKSAVWQSTVRRVLLLTAFAAAGCGEVPASGPLRQEAYVWQRDWNPSVRDAVLRRAPRFDAITVLAAEMTWRGERFETAHAQVEVSLLRRTGRPAGIALRIGPYPGPFDSEQAMAAVNACAKRLVEGYTAAGITPSELQIDFDCAESRLDGYRVWVEEIRRAAAGVPVIITALPSWLDQPAFRRLVSAADGVVLQVHSLRRPGGIDEPFTLCDPRAAQRAVARAGRMGRPFRVALPTYGYELAFSPEGRFIGLFAEKARPFPPGTRFREVRADAAAMAELVRSWSRRRPASMTGIIWYRLPVEQDTLNWRWITLERVMRGETPVPHLRASTAQTPPGLVEVDLFNDGSADAAGDVTVDVAVAGGRCVAGDGMNGFVLRHDDAGRIVFQRDPDASPAIPAGGRLKAGWLRFADAVEVRNAVVEDNPRRVSR